MRIVFVTNEYVTENNFDGGLSNYLYKISQALIARGHHVTVITSSTRDEIFINDQVEVVRVNLKLGLLDLINARQLKRFKPLLAWIIQSWKLNKVLKKINSQEHIDLVQFSSFCATGLFRPRDIKCVVRISSLQSLWDRAYGKKQKSVDKVLCWLEIKALLKADKVYGPSEVIANVLRTRYSLDVAIIEGPVKLQQDYDPSYLNQELGNKKYFLFYGTIGSLKGVLEISEILDWFFQKHSYSFVFCGKDTSFNSETMMSHILKKNERYQNRIIYLGSLAHKFLYPVIQNAEAVVLPSRVDNLPNTCTEAMTLGKIVIGSRGASFEQLIEDGVTGFLCNPQNPNSLKAAIESVIGLTQEEKRKIQERALNRMIELSPDKVAIKFESLLL